MNQEKPPVYVKNDNNAPQKYDFRECSTPGCRVVVGFSHGALHGLTTCKWCQAGKAQSI